MCSTTQYKDSLNYDFKKLQKHHWNRFRKNLLSRNNSSLTIWFTANQILQAAHIIYCKLQFLKGLNETGTLPTWYHHMVH